MIPHGVEVFVSVDTIDLRWSFDRLCAVVAGHLGREVRGGALFVFFGRRRDAVKVLFADATGLCLFYKRLDRGTFRMPEPTVAGEVVVMLEERADNALERPRILPQRCVFQLDDVDVV